MSQAQSLATVPSSSASWFAELRATAQLALPLIMTNITMILVNATDVLLLGHVGPQTLAAAAIGTGLTWAVTLFGIGLVTSSAALISAELGRRRHAVREVRRTVRQTFWAAALIAIPILLALWFAGPIMRAVGEPRQLVDDTTRYVRAFEWGVVPVLGTVVLRCFMAALERPQWVVGVGVATVLLNALVNWALIFGHLGLPALGLVGAGIGSSVVNLLSFSALATVAVQVRPFRRYHIFGRFWRADWRRFADVWRVGTPIGLQFGFESCIFGLAIVLMGYFGTVSVAAHAVAIQIASMTFMVPMGVAQAATVRVGHSYGANDAAGIKRAGWVAYLLGVGFMIIMAVLLWTAPALLVGLFIDPANQANQETFALAIRFLMVAAAFQIADGGQVVGAGVLRGLQDTRMPMIFALLGYWVFALGIGITLGFWAHWGGVGIWIGLALGLGIVAVMMLARWLLRARLGLLSLTA
jgi:MATE family multidrug resistance protein